MIQVAAVGCDAHAPRHVNDGEVAYPRYIIEPATPELVIGNLYLGPEPMVELPAAFVQGIPGTVTFRIDTDSCRVVHRITVEELGLHERLITPWVGLREGATSPCIGPEPQQVTTEVTFYSLGPAVVVIRAHEEGLPARDFEFATEVTPR